MRFYLSFIMCLLISTCFSQDYIYQNQKSYKSTPTFDFTLSDFSIGSDKGIPIQIGKSGNAGVILITANSESGRSYISGPIMIYLQNGKVLRLETRMFTDYIDDHTLALFSINSAYIADLRKSDIIRIRFNYVDSYGNKKGLSAGPESQYGVINNDLDKGDLVKYYNRIARTSSFVDSLFN
jgi:hypothetical protein